MNIVNPKSLCQIEIFINNRDETLAFYTQVFAWTFSPAVLHDCYIVEVPSDCSYGISLIVVTDHEPIKASNILYFSFENMNDIEKNLLKFYGEKSKPVYKAGYGQVLYVQDPCGNTFGLFKRDQK